MSLSSNDDEHNLWGLGVSLSIVADIIIAISLGVQKFAHNANMGADGEPILPFTKLPMWWMGIVLNVTGELGNMMALGMAPAAVVAPVGSVGIIINAWIAVAYLGEPLRFRDVVGMVLVIGSVALVIYGVPEVEQTLTVETLLSTKVLLAPRAYWFLISMAIFIVVWIVFVEPRYARRYVLVWLLLCSAISSITVAATRGFAALLRELFSDPANIIGEWLFWVLLLVIVITAVSSALYLNRAMQHFGNSEVVPIYYCTFTVASILGGALIYDELGDISAEQATFFGIGISCAFFGVALLMSGRRTETTTPPEARLSAAGDAHASSKSQVEPRPGDDPPQRQSGGTLTLAVNESAVDFVSLSPVASLARGILSSVTVSDWLESTSVRLGSLSRNLSARASGNLSNGSRKLLSQGQAVPIVSVRDGHGDRKSVV